MEDAHYSGWRVEDAGEICRECCLDEDATSEDVEEERALAELLWLAVRELLGKVIPSDSDSTGRALQKVEKAHAEYARFRWPHKPVKEGGS